VHTFVADRYKRRICIYLLTILYSSAVSRHVNKLILPVRVFLEVFTVRNIKLLKKFNVRFQVLTVASMKLESSSI
jgi:hypothetical protein